MLKTLYVFIITTATIVQINECQDYGIANNHSSSRPARKSIFPVLKRSSNDDVKFFETISESTATSTTTLKPYFERKRKNNMEVDFGEIKGLLSKLLDKIQDMEKESNSKREAKYVEEEEEVAQNTIPIEITTVVAGANKKRAKKSKKRKRKEKLEKRARWGKWTDWSPCSVSCGKGREIRWRHCLENCEVAETEMEEKTCQLPACGPSKLFGVIKL